MIQTTQSPQSPIRTFKRNASPQGVPSKKRRQRHNENNHVETRRAGIDIEQNLKADCVTPERIIRENPRITWAPQKPGSKICPDFL